MKHQQAANTFITEIHAHCNCAEHKYAALGTSSLSMQMIFTLQAIWILLCTLVTLRAGMIEEMTEVLRKAELVKWTLLAFVQY